LSQSSLRRTAGVTDPISSAIHLCESGQIPSRCG
jgi:hypothetical protein